jgi:5-methylcytosine-specific restriction protein A
VARRPPHACAYPGCARLIIVGARCERHGGTRADKAYYHSAAWQQLRRAALERDGWLCQARGCTQRASHVDHIHPRAGDPDHDRLSNLQSLCATHHGEKTNQDRVGSSDDPRAPRRGSARARREYDEWRRRWGGR